MQKTLCYDAADLNHGFVAVGFVGNKPVAFGLFEECTPRFVEDRSFITRAFHSDLGGDVSAQLLAFFEAWAKKEGVKVHIITTRRRSGAAKRLFTSSKYNFKPGPLAFEKLL